MQSSLNRKFVLLIKSCLAVLVFFLTIEMCARLDDKVKYDAPFFANYNYSRLKAIDEEGIMRNVPCSRFEKWQNNSCGFRGQEISPAKPRGTKRIICMGTSETYGLYESPGREWPAQLSYKLKPLNKYQVMNASVVGMGLKEFKPYINKYVFRYKPDIIILFVNPYGYLIRLEGNNGNINNQTRTSGLVKDNPFNIELRSLIKLKLKVKEAIKNNIPPFLLKPYQIVMGLKQVSEAERIRLKNRKPLDSVSPCHLAAFHDDLANLVCFLRGHGIKVILNSCPLLITERNIAEYYGIFLEARSGGVELSLHGMVDAADKINSEIESVSLETKADFIDSQKAVPKNLEYFADIGHYTDKGAEIIASNIARYLLVHDYYQ